MVMVGRIEHNDADIMLHYVVVNRLHDVEHCVSYWEHHAALFGYFMRHDYCNDVA